MAIASSIAASRFHTLIHHGAGSAAALTGGFTAALWVCCLTGLLAIPVVFVLVRRSEISKAVAVTAQHGEAIQAASLDTTGAIAG